jgi:molybdate transport system substrate-binding protein
MTLTPLCWSRQPLRPTAFMPFLLRLTIVLASLLPALADAEQVRVFVAGAAKAGVEALLPGFGHTDGDTIQASYDTAGALRDRVLKGEEPDLVVLSDAAVDALAVRGLIRDGDRREIGVVVVGLAVRQGAPLPDITTADALRPQNSGAQFDVAVDGLGVRAQIAPKLTVLPTGGEVLRGVASGKFELGVSQSSEILPVAGVAFVGGLPAPYDLRTPYAIAVLGGSAQGRRLMRYLDSAAAHARFEASGFSTN